MTGFFTLTDVAVRLYVLAVPGASKSEVKEVRNSRIRIRIAATPEENKANEELRSFLAKILGCAKKEVVIVSGEKSRFKTVEVPLFVKEKISPSIVN